MAVQQIRNPTTLSQDFTMLRPDQTLPFRRIASAASDDLQLQERNPGNAEDQFLQLIESSTVLDPHQKRVAGSLTHPAVAAVDAPTGSGKTYLMAHTVQLMLQTKMANYVVVISESNDAVGAIAGALVNGHPVRSSVMVQE